MAKCAATAVDSPTSPTTRRLEPRGGDRALPGGQRVEPPVDGVDERRGRSAPSRPGSPRCRGGGRASSSDRAGLLGGRAEVDGGLAAPRADLEPACRRRDARPAPGRRVVEGQALVVGHEALDGRRRGRAARRARLTPRGRLRPRCQTPSAREDRRPPTERMQRAGARRAAGRGRRRRRANDTPTSGQRGRDEDLDRLVGLGREAGGLDLGEVAELADEDHGEGRRDLTPARPGVLLGARLALAALLLARSGTRAGTRAPPRNSEPTTTSSRRGVQEREQRRRRRPRGPSGR